MKIIFLDAASVGKVSLKAVAELGELITYQTSTAAEALARVGDAEVLLVNKIKVNAALLDAAPKLKLICEVATGTDNIDLAEAARRGIPVKNVAGYSTDSVAQLVFAQILSLACDTPRFDTYVKDGSYTGSGLFTDASAPYMELTGKTLGIIGLGAIGSKVAKIGEAFGMKVLYYSTTGKPHDTQYRSVSLEELLRCSDVVSVHCPKNERTSGLIGEQELKMMKPTSIIVNMARGGIIDEQALAQAVSAGTIYGAAVDVFTTEPAANDNPLLHTTHPERLRFTPHVGWASREAIERLIEKTAANIRTILTALLLFFVTSVASAQTFHDNHNNLSINVGMTTQTVFTFRAGYHYLFNEYVGIGAGAFVCRDFGTSRRPYGTDGTIQWRSYSNVRRGGLNLSALARLPFADGRFSAELEPAWLVSRPYTVQSISFTDSSTGDAGHEGASYRGGQWSSWLVRAGFNWHINQFIGIGLSYSLTDFDNYDIARRIEYRGTSFSTFYPAKTPVNHWFSLGLILAF